MKETLAGRIFSCIQHLEKGVTAELHALFPSNYQMRMPLNLAADDYRCVWEAEERTVKE